VRSVVHSDIATGCTRSMKGRTYDRWRLFARQLFDIAEADGIVSRSPFDAKRIPRAKKESVQRHAPTVDEFTKIVTRSASPHGSAEWKTRRPASVETRRQRRLCGVSRTRRRRPGRSLELGVGAFEKSRIDSTRQKTKKSILVPIYPMASPASGRSAEESRPEASGLFSKVDNVKHSLTSACQRLGLPHFTQRSLPTGMLGACGRAAWTGK